MTHTIQTGNCEAAMEGKEVAGKASCTACLNPRLILPKEGDATPTPVHWAWTSAMCPSP